MRSILTTPEIERLIAENAPVAIGVSGGKDSDIAAIETVRYLDARGHAGPRVLIEADLGEIEHDTARSQCRRLADYLAMELIVVYPPHPMIERWELRWSNNLARYADLRCVKMILPWSTPAMRFCTSEEKDAPGDRALKRRFPGQTVIKVAGIRRQESPKRAKSPIVKLVSNLTRKKKVDRKNGVITPAAYGYNWFPILDWLETEVRQAHLDYGFALNPVYDEYGLSRFSCRFCIMGSAPDTAKSAAIPSSRPVYRRLVRLEAASGFSFQAKWLGDVRPDLLSDDERAALALAKERARLRDRAESVIPKHLLYVKGWPTVCPTEQEAVMLAGVRREIARLYDIEVNYTTPEAILARYKELMDINAARTERKARQEERRAARQRAA